VKFQLSLKNIHALGPSCLTRGNIIPEDGLSRPFGQSENQ